MKRGDLAKLSGVSYPYLSELENGTKQGSTQKIAQIAEALGMTASQLLARAEALGLGAPAPQAAPSYTTAPPPVSAGAPVFGYGGGVAGAPVDDARTRSLSSSAASMRSLRPLAPPPADPEAIVVDRVTRLVRAEIERWLDVELEPLVREQVREALRREQ